MDVRLDDRDRELLDGAHGEAGSLAMRILVRMARAQGAAGLRDVTRAHIDGCLYHGRAGLDFARRMVDGGGRVAVPTTLNVASLDLLHPERYRGDPETARHARSLMDAYVELGCRPTWTCAPYQLPEARPALGEHVAWAESNAIVFANSVLGARTDRYGDFLDICAAITGRVPEAGLHLDEHRRGEIMFRVEGIGSGLLGDPVLYPLVGHVVGRASGSRVPVLVGLPGDASEDDLKALGAAAASSGSVALFHAVGLTPEAPTLDEALGGRPPLREETIGPERLRAAREELTTSRGERLTGVSLGTPHFSVEEFRGLLEALEGGRIHPDVECYVSTGRDVLAEVESRGWLAPIEAAGVRIVTDTCTYVTPIMPPGGVVMTNSGKWAYYAPGNLGIATVFGSLEECVRSALAGRVTVDEELWRG
ncbi:MAG TPA: aconitase X catalytic domain-containing protein [Actinomycetota bacterium]